MRLHEREAYYQWSRGVVTMDDMERDRKAREAQARKQAELDRRAAKAAMRGPALLEVGDE